MGGAAKRSLIGATEMEFRILGPLEVRRDGRPLTLGGAKSARAARVPAPARERGRLERPADRRALGRAPPASGRDGAPGPRLAAAEGARPGRRAARDEAAGLRPSVSSAASSTSTASRGSSRRRTGPSAAVAARAAARGARAVARPAAGRFRYESFAQPAIGRLEELRLTALERRIDADLALGRHADAGRRARGPGAEHPLRERFIGQLMLALYRSGRQTEALAAYREGDGRSDGARHRAERGAAGARAGDPAAGSGPRPGQASTARSWSRRRARRWSRPCSRWPSRSRDGRRRS